MLYHLVAKDVVRYACANLPLHVFSIPLFDVRFKNELVFVSVTWLLLLVLVLTFECQARVAIYLQWSHVTVLVLPEDTLHIRMWHDMAIILCRNLEVACRCPRCKGSFL